MWQEKVNAFFEKVESDEGLQAKLGAVREESEKKATARVAEIASAEGFEFTAAELVQVCEAQRERLDQLSPEELMAVAGGRRRGGSLSPNPRPKPVNSGKNCCYYAQGSMPGFVSGIEAY